MNNFKLRLSSKIKKPEAPKVDLNEKVELPKLNRKQRRAMVKKLGKALTLKPHARSQYVRDQRPFAYEPNALSLAPKTGRRRRAEKANRSHAKS
jgi:hypothetical protein